MQVTINALLFCAGFALAACASLRRKGDPAGLRRLFDDLQSLFVSVGAVTAVGAGVSQSTLPQHNRDGRVAESAPRDVKTPSREARAPSVPAQGENRYLMTRAQVEREHPHGSWQRDAYESIKARITAKGRGETFPCIYATRGFHEDGHRYVFVPGEDPTAPRCVRVIGEALRAYLAAAPAMGDNTSMVIVCRPRKSGAEEMSTAGVDEAKSSTTTMDDYSARFWGLLRALRTLDSREWPGDVPSRTDAPRWTFCFDGQPLFPVALTPLHRARRSRWAPALVVALQPKWALDRLLGTPRKRRAATGAVRALLREYDAVPASPLLTAYGEAGTSEAGQLVLHDDNDVARGACPYQDLDL